jgi:ribosomal protein L3
MGSETITIANREIVDIKDNLILIKGPIPGPKESLIAIYTK